MTLLSVSFYLTRQYALRRPKFYKDAYYMAAGWLFVDFCNWTLEIEHPNHWRLFGL